MERTASWYPIQTSVTLWETNRAPQKQPNLTLGLTMAELPAPKALVRIKGIPRCHLFMGVMNKDCFAYSVDTPPVSSWLSTQTQLKVSTYQD